MIILGKCKKILFPEIAHSSEFFGNGKDIVRYYKWRLTCE